MVTKVLCVTKDDYDFIETYIVFYGTIFGYDNVIIIDNGSSDQRVLDVYNNYPHIDLTVDPFPFLEAPDHMTRHIMRYKGKCDWIVVADTDEYIFWEGDEVLDQEKVRNYIESLPSQAHFGKVYASSVPYDAEFLHPAAEITTFTESYLDKVIIKMDIFEGIIVWPHNTIPSEQAHATEGLQLLHFHNTGQKRHIERTLKFLKGCHYIEGTETIEEQIYKCRFLVDRTADNYHRVQYYLDHLRGRAKSKFVENTIEIKQVANWFRRDSIFPCLPQAPPSQNNSQSPQPS